MGCRGVSPPPSLEDKGSGNHHRIKSPGIYPHVETILICYPSSASVSHTYGFYGSPESLMPGRDPCHLCQLACGPCFLTSFLPTLSDCCAWFPFYPAFSQRAFPEHSHLRMGKKKYNQDTRAFQYSLDCLPGNFHY